MENIIRNVRDIDNGDRRAIEHVVGQTLRDNQRLVIQIQPRPERRRTGS
jgi:hypothetical protein